MPPIPVHIDEPVITAKKVDGITAQSSVEAAQAPLDAAPTQTLPLSYPAAKPGASAVPGPTPPILSPQTQPTPTRTGTSDYGPPPPQPGAVPVVPGQQPQLSATRTLPPPPPRAGESVQRQAGVTAMPSQIGLPPPLQGYAPTHSTMNSSPEPPRTGATTLNFGAAPAPQINAGSHPPGYQQNAMAQEMNSAARASLDAQERREGLTSGGLLGRDNSNDLGGAGMWNAVKGWANTAGKTLAEAEKEVWQRINKS